MFNTAPQTFGCVCIDFLSKLASMQQVIDVMIYKGREELEVCLPLHIQLDSHEHLDVPFAAQLSRFERCLQHTHA